MIKNVDQFVDTLYRDVADLFQCGRGIDVKTPSPVYSKLSLSNAQDTYDEKIKDFPL